mmetsp:Transcript_102221/g.288781  ORF Transcript_102221/g.288781 Transcript_102221/m.288781 type:complete len:259 (+) Transcript_102221:765-1541(+)
MKFFWTSRNTFKVAPAATWTSRNNSVGLRSPSVATKRTASRCIAFQPCHSSKGPPACWRLARKVCHIGRTKNGNWSMKRMRRPTPSLVNRKRYLPCVRSLKPSWLSMSRMTRRPMERAIEASATTAHGKLVAPAAAMLGNCAGLPTFAKALELKATYAPRASPVASAEAPAPFSVASSGTDSDHKKTIDLSAAGHIVKSARLNQAANPCRSGLKGSTVSSVAVSSTRGLTPPRTAACNAREVKGLSATARGASRAVRP